MPTTCTERAATSGAMGAPTPVSGVGREPNAAQALWELGREAYVMFASEEPHGAQWQYAVDGRALLRGPVP